MTTDSTLSSSARRALRAAAHHLDPVVMVGQHGLTPAVLHEIDLALTAHALIKVRVQSDERETREGFLAEICEKLGCESVQHLGKLLVLWRNAAGADDEDEAGDEAAPRAAKPGRGPRSKLPSAPGADSRAPARGARGEVNADGTRRRYGDPVPPPPRREGWAPKDRRGAARFGGDNTDSRRRDGDAPPYGAPRARTGGPAGAGGPPTGGPRGFKPGGPRGYGQGGGDAGAPRSRWGERRDEGGESGFGGGDRRPPAPRGSYGGRGDAAGGTGRPPRGGGYGGPPGAAPGGDRGGSWGGNSRGRDGITGKPSGFSRGPAGGGGRTGAGRGAGGPPAGGAKPRTRRRLG